jgi:hypothetical protein
MLERKPFIGFVVITCIGGLWAGACGPAPAPGAGGSGGTGNGPGVGGTGGSTGPLGCSAASVGGGAGVPFTTERCPDAPAQDLPLDQFQPCTMNACNDAHCIPKTLIAALPNPIDQSLLGACQDPSTLCVPDDYSKPFARFKPKSCSSLGGAEGRCISTCIPQVNGLMDVLPKADCGQNEVCAPCFNPNDGKATGACSQGCDPGPSEQTTQNPYVFQKCQGGTGVCAPSSVIPPVLMTQLIPYECPVGTVCAPIAKTQDLKYNFPSCQPGNPFTAVLAGVGPNGQTGGCVPQWLADANPLEAVFLQQDTCLSGEKCAPCNNPLRGFVPTGACPVPLCSDASGGKPPQIR